MPNGEEIRRLKEYVTLLEKKLKAKDAEIAVLKLRLGRTVSPKEQPKK